MRILFTVLSYKPAYRVGGPVVSATALAENLVNRGHQVVVFTSNSNLDEDLDVPTNQPVMVDGVETWYFKHTEPVKESCHLCIIFHNQWVIFTCHHYKKFLVKEYKVSILIHTHTPFIYPTLAVARSALKHRIPVFYRQHGVFAPNYLHFRGHKERIYISLFEKPIMQNATYLLA